MSDGTGARTSAGSPPPRWVIKTLTRLHCVLHDLTGGRYFNRLGGDEVCFVSMRGARSNRTLTLPLMHIPHGDGILLVASQGGAPEHPAWYFNLLKHPDIEVSYRGRRTKMRARLATSAEKADLWPVCDASYAPFARYRQRTTRDIPIFVCQPVSPTPPA